VIKDVAVQPSPNVDSMPPLTEVHCLRSMCCRSRVTSQHICRMAMHVLRFRTTASRYSVTLHLLRFSRSRASSGGPLCYQTVLRTQTLKLTTLPVSLACVPRSCSSDKLYL
jgi:hypothetical protein